MEVTLEEGERQTTLLALAELSLRRPRWLNHLERIADKFGGRRMFDGFRETNRDLIRPTAEPTPVTGDEHGKPILRSAEEIARYNQFGRDDG